MGSIASIFAEHMLAICLVAAAAVTFMAFVASSRFRLWVRDFWVTFPVIGTMARLSKDRTQANNGWLRAEETLCATYEPFSSLRGPKEFARSIEYMRKAADLGRTPTPFGVWALLVVLVIAEGLGFSYLLGTWMAREGSENTHTVMMLAIVFVLCAVLVWITHSAGKQYRRTSLLRSCFKRFKDLGAKEYSADLVQLDTDQSIDNHEPAFKQTVNRVAENSHDLGGYGWVITAVITIAFIAIVSTVMRYQNLQASHARDALMTSTQVSGNPFATTLPDEIVAPDAEARKNGQSDISSSEDLEALAAFSMLAFIFVITQIVGIGAGYKFSFVGMESKSAFEVTKGFATYAEYLRNVTPLHDLANGRLKELQQKLEEKAHTKLNLHKTFDDYLIESRERRGKMIGETWSGPQGGGVKQPEGAGIPGTPSPAAGGGQSQSGFATDTVGAAIGLNEAITQMQRLDNADAEKAYFQSLPAALQRDAQLIAWLKERKANREAMVNVDELF